jgi:hypothetical protein
MKWSKGGGKNVGRRERMRVEKQKACTYIKGVEVRKRGNGGAGIWSRLARSERRGNYLYEFPVGEDSFRLLIQKADCWRNWDGRNRVLTVALTRRLESISLGDTTVERSFAGSQ